MDASTQIRKELLTDKEAGAMLGISSRFLWRLASAGKAPKPVRLGGATRWRAADLTAFIAGLSDSQ